MSYFLYPSALGVALLNIFSIVTEGLFSQKVGTMSYIFLLYIIPGIIYFLFGVFVAWIYERVKRNRY
ncbi:hypothetical protein A3G54_00470 [Candidatus Giovannonibacteria bacterium RIFCSPLOWO2_12_FULL_44_15]|uniref:Uncharacterized protein n=1 Tax=Candidatus Giovannonibacteria bacterium RIFCSPLOWO2_12_FULL_44_15 TaxID=1798364 RepID=A0A1F5Y0B1_9BACT|nr:MAG: hypothetical protein A3G54_00470 [Candidatus Giovannonibacteria bacterium RIFCSPLOWO2_12_FULL_44_15]